MRKRISLVVLTLTLFLSGLNVHAVEKENKQMMNKYVNFFLDEIKGTKSEESILSLKESLEELLKNIRPEDAKKTIDFIDDKIEEGKWNSEKGIKEAIEDAEKEFNVTFTKEQKEKILSVVAKIKKLGIAPEYIMEQAEEIYEKYGEELKEGIEKEKEKVIEETQKKIKEEVNKSISDYFSDMVNSVKSFFKGIFRK